MVKSKVSRYKLDKLIHKEGSTTLLNAEERQEMDRMLREYKSIRNKPGFVKKNSSSRVPSNNRLAHANSGLLKSALISFSVAAITAVSLPFLMDKELGGFREKGVPVKEDNVDLPAHSPIGLPESKSQEMRERTAKNNKPAKEKFEAAKATQWKGVVQVHRQKETFLLQSPGELKPGDELLPKLITHGKNHTNHAAILVRDSRGMQLVFPREGGKTAKLAKIEQWEMPFRYLVLNESAGAELVLLVSNREFSALEEAVQIPAVDKSKSSFRKEVDNEWIEAHVFRLSDKGKQE